MVQRVRKSDKGRVPCWRLPQRSCEEVREEERCRGLDGVEDEGAQIGGERRRARTGGCQEAEPVGAETHGRWMWAGTVSDGQLGATGGERGVVFEIALSRLPPEQAEPVVGSASALASSESGLGLGADPWLVPPRLAKM